MSVYRITFEGELSYQIDCALHEEGEAAAVTATVFRLRPDGSRDGEPLVDSRGAPMLFEGPSEHLALMLACDVLEQVHDRPLIRIRQRGTSRHHWLRSAGAGPECDC